MPSRAIQTPHPRTPLSLLFPADATRQPGIIQHVVNSGSLLGNRWRNKQLGCVYRLSLTGRGNNNRLGSRDKERMAEKRLRTLSMAVKILVTHHETTPPHAATYISFHCMHLLQVKAALNQKHRRMCDYVGKVFFTTVIYTHTYTINTLPNKAHIWQHMFAVKMPLHHNILSLCLRQSPASLDTFPTISKVRLSGLNNFLKILVSSVKLFVLVLFSWKDTNLWQSSKQTLSQTYSIIRTALNRCHLWQTSLNIYSYFID